MTRRLRLGLVLLCVAGIAGVVSLVVSEAGSALANGVGSLARLVFVVAALAGLVTTATAIGHHDEAAG